MILKNATRQETEALSRLRSNEHEAILTLIKALEVEALGRLAKADDVVAIYRLQGRVAFLQDFLQAVETAPEQLRRMMESGPGRP
jgi:hypothetical protein